MMDEFLKKLNNCSTDDTKTIFEQKDTMRDLWNKASELGPVSLRETSYSGDEEKTYTCSVSMDSKKGIDITIKSDYKVPCPEIALQQVIERGQKVKVEK